MSVRKRRTKHRRQKQEQLRNLSKRTYRKSSNWLVYWALLRAFNMCFKQCLQTCLLFAFLGKIVRHIVRILFEQHVNKVQTTSLKLLQKSQKLQINQSAMNINQTHAHKEKPRSAAEIQARLCRTNSTILQESVGKHMQFLGTVLCASAHGP